MSLVKQIFALFSVDYPTSQVRVNTVLGSAAPPLSVKLMQIFTSGSKDASIIQKVWIIFFSGLSMLCMSYFFLKVVVLCLVLSHFSIILNAGTQV